MQEPTPEELKEYREKLTEAVVFYRQFGPDGLYSVPESIRDIYHDLIIMNKDYIQIFEQQIMQATFNAFEAGYYAKEIMAESIIENQLVIPDHGEGVTRDQQGDPAEETKKAVASFINGSNHHIEDLRQVFVDSVEQVFRIGQ